MTSTLESVCTVVSSEGVAGTAVEVSGPLTWEHAPGFRASVPEVEEGNRLLIDLSRVPRLDSAGTGAVVSTYLHAHRRDVPVAVLATGDVQAVLDRIGMAQLVPVFSDREAAYGWLAGESGS